jgi:hypothetical protein
MTLSRPMSFWSMWTVEKVSDESLVDVDSQTQSVQGTSQKSERRIAEQPSGKSVGRAQQTSHAGVRSASGFDPVARRVVRSLRRQEERPWWSNPVRFRVSRGCSPL